MSFEIDAHVQDKYTIQKRLGKGAYGVVWQAIDKQTQKQVALKKIFDAFQNSTDAQRTYREVMYLVQLNGHSNIIRLQTVLRSQNHKDLYLVFDLMESDLHNVIRARILKDLHKTYIIYQLFKALKFIHSAELIHRDLKPSNLLLNKDCQMKLADFGLARLIKDSQESNLGLVSDYIATRWYRAPEILLGSWHYTKKVDIWSAGCILGEVLLEQVLFAGSSSVNQIEVISSLIGRPSEKDIAAMGITMDTFQVQEICSDKKYNFSSLFKGCDPSAVDLLRKILVFNPQKRPEAKEVLQHPYFFQFHNESEEIECPQKIQIKIQDNDKQCLSLYREEIYRLINSQIRSAQKLDSQNSKKTAKMSQDYISKKENKFQKEENLQKNNGPQIRQKKAVNKQKEILVEQKRIKQSKQQAQQQQNVLKNFIVHKQHVFSKHLSQKPVKEVQQTVFPVKKQGSFFVSNSVNKCNILNPKRSFNFCNANVNMSNKSPYLASQYNELRFKN